MAAGSGDLFGLIGPSVRKRSNKSARAARPVGRVRWRSGKGRGLDWMRDETRCQGDYATPGEAWRRSGLLFGPVPLRRCHQHLYLSAGKELLYQTTKHDRVGVQRKVYKARAADCGDCAFRPQCRPGAHGRRIVGSENVPVVAAYVAKMRTEAARPISRWRDPVAEFSNLAFVKFARATQ